MNRTRCFALVMAAALALSGCSVTHMVAVSAETDTGKVQVTGCP